MAGALLLAVPVVVAAAIGFGNSFSGITGGLSALAEGPETTQGTTSTAAPERDLDKAVVALADPAPGGGGTGGDESGGGSGQSDLGTSDTGSVGGGGGGSTQTGGDGGGGSPGAPQIPLPPPPGGGGGGGGSGDPVGDLAQGLGNTVNQILGGGTQ